MSNPTSNYSWQMPTSSDLVTDLPADFEVFGQAVDTQVYNNAQAAIAKTLIDAKGDLIVGSAADTAARLAVGTNDYVLTADSTTATGLKWANPAAGGGYTLLSTTTFSGSTTSITSISQSYKFLFVYWTGVYNSSNDENLQVQFNSDTGSNYNASGYLSREVNGIGATGGYQAGSFNIGQLGSSSTAGATNSGSMFFYNYTSTGNKAFEGSSRWKTTAQWGGWRIDGNYTGGSAISSIQFSPSGGTFSGGTVYVYGVN